MKSTIKNIIIAAAAVILASTAFAADKPVRSAKEDEMIRTLIENLESGPVERCTKRCNEATTAGACRQLAQLSKCKFSRNEKTEKVFEALSK